MGGFLPVRLRARLVRDRTFGSSVVLTTTMLIFDGQPVEVYCQSDREGDALAWLSPPNRIRLKRHQIGES
jgi:hypothetical protein